MYPPQFQPTPAVISHGSQTMVSPARPAFTPFPFNSAFSPAGVYASECTGGSLPREGQTVTDLNKNVAVLVFYTFETKPMELGSCRSAFSAHAQCSQFLLPIQQHSGEGTYATLQHHSSRADSFIEETGSREKDLSSTRTALANLLQLNRLCRGLEPSRKERYQESQRRLAASRKPETPHVQRRRKRAGATSRFRGVSWHRRDRRWIARAWIRGKITTVGSFKSELEAAKAVETRYIEEYGVEDATDISKVLQNGSMYKFDPAQPRSLDEALSRLEAVQPFS